MKIAISSDTGEVSAHFGRAPEFTIVTIEDNKVIEKKEIPNPGHSVGTIPKFINEQGAICMIAGGMGPRAIGFFKEYGIEVVIGISGNVDDVIEKFVNNTLEGSESICSPGAGKDYGVEKIHTEADDNDKHHHHDC